MTTPITPLSERELDALRTRHAELPAGPWAWRGLFGSEVDDVASSSSSVPWWELAPVGVRADGVIQIRDAVLPPVREGHSTLSPTACHPVWGFLSDSWELVGRLLATVDQRDALLGRFAVDCEAYRQGRADERADLIRALGQRRLAWLARHGTPVTAADALDVARELGRLECALELEASRRASARPLPLSEEVSRYRQALERVESALSGELMWESDSPALAALHWARKALASDWEG